MPDEAVYVNGRLPLVPPGVVTVTDTVPLPGGTVAVQDVPSRAIHLTFVAGLPPKLTSGAGPSR
jgi:hypothetical protein